MPGMPTLDEQLCFTLYSASMAVNRAYKPLLDRLGITYPQYLVLSTLWEEDDRPVGAIATRLGLEASTVTPLVKRLETAGLVTRRRNMVDERLVHVSVTEKGRALHEQSRCLGEALVEASRMRVSELIDLNERMRTFRDAVSTYGRDEPDVAA